MSERETKFTIAEGYDLPSKGAIYEVKVNPHVELRSMTARDEMQRLAPSTMPFKVLADIIENCMLEKPAIPVYDMCLGDYEYLLHRLRIVTYGDSYRMTVKCPNEDCGEIVEAETHLNTLELKEYDEEVVNNLQNIRLPDSGQLITLKFQTPRMLDERETRIKELRKKWKTNIDFKTFVTLLQIIDTVDGEKLVGSKLEDYINRLTAKDMLKVLQGSDELTNSIGLNTTLSATCPECGVEFETFFRLGPEFFRPIIK